MFSNEDLLVSPYSASDSHTMYDTYFKDGDLSYAEWKEQFFQYSAISKFAMLDYRDSFLGQKRKTIGIMRTVAAGEEGYVNLLVIMDPGRLFRDASKLGSITGGSILLLDSENSLLDAAGGVDWEENLQYKDFAETEGTKRLLLGGRQRIITWHTSRINGWKCMSVVPAQVFHNKINIVYTIIIICIAGYLCVGVSLIWLALQVNYNPVKELLGTLGQGRVPEKTGENNEYYYIRQAINDLLEAQDRDNYLLRKQKEELRQMFLLRLLKGRETNLSKAVSSFGFYQINVKTENCCVAVLYLQDAGNRPEKGTGMDRNNIFQMTLEIVARAVGEFLMEKGIVVEVEGLLAILVSLEDDWDIVRHQLGEIPAYLKQQCNVDCLVTLSKVHHGIEEIPTAYSEAVEIMEYRLLLGSEMVCYEELESVYGEEYYYPLEKEQQLMGCMKYGDWEGASQLLSDIFNRNLQGRVLSVKSVKCLMFDLAGTVLKSVNEMGHSPDNADLMDMAPVESILKCNDIGEMKKEIENSVKEICGYVREKKKETTGQSRLAAEVKEYVLNHFEEVSLNVDSIGEAFHMTSHYLSQIFKKQTGTGLHDYIDITRIRKAEYLLTDTKQDIGTIGENIGYGNVNTFIRVFKKYAGITPGKYRERSQKDQ